MGGDGSGWTERHVKENRKKPRLGRRILKTEYFVVFSGFQGYPESLRPLRDAAVERMRCACSAGGCAARHLGIVVPNTE